MNKFFFLFLYFPLSVVAQTLSPEKIYSTVAPSIVSINDIDSQGSGVVLSTSGDILTNYHVVASTLPVTVKASVINNGKVRTQIFKEVQVVKVHNQYDLALLKIKLPPNTRLLRAKKLSPIDKKVATGATCYAIGNPQGLEKSISSGLVSSVDRKHNGLSYIQISAPINPGNSGGAICNNKGQVIGIATWKLDGTDNIGFAIPIQDLKLGDFVDPSKRAGNKKLGIRYEKEAHRYYDDVQKNRHRYTTDQYNFHILTITQLYKEVLFHMPNESASYHNIGLMYNNLMKYRYAERYLLNANKLAPDNLNTMAALLLSYRSQNKSENAAKLSEKMLALEATPNSDDALYQANAASALASYYSRKTAFVKTAYFLKWSLSLEKSLASSTSRVKRTQLNNNMQYLNSAQQAYLSGGALKCSFAKLKSFENLTVADLERIKRQKKNATLKLFGDQSKALVDLAKGEPIQPLPEEGVSIWFPEKPTKIIEAYGSKYILAYLPNYKKIAVLDTIKARFIRFINHDYPHNNVRWAAGGHNLALYDKNLHSVHIIDMRTWKKLKTYEVDKDREIRNLHMKMDSGSKVIIEYTSEPINNSFEYYIPASGAVIPVRVEGTQGNSRDYARFSSRIPKLEIISPNRSNFAYTSNYNKIYNFEIREDHISITNLNPNNSSDKRVFTESSIYTSDSGNFIYNKKALYNIKSDAIISSFEQIAKDNYCVGYFHGKEAVIMKKKSKDEFFLKVYSLPNLNEVVSIKVQPSSSTKTSFIFGSAYTNRFGELVDGDRKMILYSFKAKASEEIAPITPGTEHRKKIDIKLLEKATIDSGPEGASIDKTTGELVWNIPEDQERGKEATFVIGYFNNTGEQDYKIIKIYVP